jgi:hypothetical protein
MIRLCALLSAVAILACAEATAAPRTLIVSAPNRDYHDALCRVLLAAPSGAKDVVLHLGKQIVPAQTRRVGGKLEVAWMIGDLAKGKQLQYKLAFAKKPTATKDQGVKITRAGANLEIFVNGALFTRYDVTTGPNKPYFWPIYGPDSKMMVRNGPLRQVEGETTDHPHHRGMWFTHGSVNGADFWDETSKAASTKNRNYDEIISGPVYGVIRASTDWIEKGGKKALEDAREFTIYSTSSAIVMDLDVTMKATQGSITFGDTKEGTFGIRIPDSMRVKGGDGHMISSTGLKDGDVWGKRAEWIDYYGTVQGATMGIAIFDNPGNFRHPTYWHARDYGLFAVNPFGIHDFVPGEKAGAGDYTVPAGGSQPFRYRVIFHRGDATAAGIGDAWGAYIDPPHVTVK